MYLISGCIRSACNSFNAFLSPLILEPEACTLRLFRLGLAQGPFAHWVMEFSDSELRVEEAPFRDKCVAFSSV